MTIIILFYFLSAKVFINFYYSFPGFELDFHIGRIEIEDKLEESFNSSDVLCFGDNAKWDNYKLYSICSYDNLIKCLPKPADLLKECV